MWWLRRMTSVALPNCRARGISASMPLHTRNGPGRRWPSHSSDAPRSETTLGSPERVMRPASSSLT